MATSAKLATALATGWAVVRSMLVYGITGTLASWVMLYFIGEQLVAWGWRIVKQMQGDLALLGVLPPLFIGLLFFLGFPFAYVSIGQRIGLQQALAFVYGRHGPELMHYIAERLVERVRPTLARAAQTSKSDTVHRLVIDYTQQLDDMPQPLRLVMRRVAKRTDFARIAGHAMLSDDGQLADTPVIATRISAALRERVEPLVRPSSTAFWAVLGGEVAIFVACKLWLPASVQ
jgi:hypothetical protein